MAIGLPRGWQVENINGTPVSGAKIYTWVDDGVTTPRSLYTDKDCTVPAANPIVADSAGWWNVYQKSSESVHIVVKSADDSITYTQKTYPSAIDNAQPVDATLTALAGLTIADGDIIEGTGPDAFRVTKRTVATLAALQAITSPQANDLVYMQGRASAGDNGGGLFRFSTVDLSTEVSADEWTSSQGDGDDYIAPASDATGASGAWVRIGRNKERTIYVAEYGYIGDGTSHPVSEWIGATPTITPPFGGTYANLTALQADFPHVAATTDEIDWAASQLAVDRIGNTYGRVVVWPDSQPVFNKQLEIGDGSTSAYSTVNGYKLVFGTAAGFGIQKALDNNEPLDKTGVWLKATAALDPVVKFSGPITGAQIDGTLVVDCNSTALSGVEIVSVNSSRISGINAFNWLKYGIKITTVQATTVETSPHNINSAELIVEEVSSFSAVATTYPKAALWLTGYKASSGPDTTTSIFHRVRLGSVLNSGTCLMLGATDGCAMMQVQCTSYGTAKSLTLNLSSGSVLDTATDTITSNAHGLHENDRVVYGVGGGAAPAGLTDATEYWAVNVTTNTFQLANSPGGSAIDITGLGTGTTHTIASKSPWLRIKGDNVPITVPTQIFIYYASPGDDQDVEVDNTDGTAGQVLISNYALDEGAPLPSGLALSHIGAVLRVTSSSLAAMNGVSVGLWSKHKIDAPGNFGGGFYAYTGGDPEAPTDKTQLWSLTRGTNNDVHVQSLGGVSFQSGAASASDSRQVRLSSTDAELRSIFLKVANATNEITIASGAATATGTYHTIDTEGDAASDDLDTLSGAAIGRIVILRPANDARTVVVKHGTGNLLIGSDFTMDSQVDCIGLFCIDGSNWIQLFRSDNGS